MTRNYSKWNNTSLTDHATLVIKRANEEACRLKHVHIATEHLLMGLLYVCMENETCVASAIFKNKKYECSHLLSDIQEIITPTAHGMTIMGDLPTTPRAMHVLHDAETIAQKLKHNFIGTEHILLGLLKEQECVAACILNKHGFTFDKTLEAVKRCYEDHKDYQHYRDLPLKNDTAAHDAVMSEDTHEDFVRLTSPLGRPLYIRKLSINCIRDYGKGNINTRRVWVGGVIHYVRESVDEIMALITK